MKFIHLADLHIGKSVCDFSMIEDQEYILKKVVELAREEKVDAVLIAGDVYDRTVPSEEAVRLFDNFIYELTQIPVKVLVISGNHDSDERLNFGSRLFTEKGVYFGAKYDGNIRKVTLDDDFGGVNFYLMPFVKASEVKHFNPDAEIEDYDSAIKYIIKNANVDTAERNVILAHQFVAGKSGEVTLSGSEGSATAHVGLVERIGCDCFDSFDYAALGHIHKAQCVGRDEVRYSGTLLKYHIDEVADEKSIPVVTMGEKGEVSIKLEPVKPLRDMRKLKGKLADILSADNVTDTDDYIFAVLTDEDTVMDAMSIMRQNYPNTMYVRYENSHTKELAMGDQVERSKMRSFSEMISDFYLEMYETDISDEELQIMKDAAGKAGVEIETD